MAVVLIEQRNGEGEAAAASRLTGDSRRMVRPKERGSAKGSLWLASWRSGKRNSLCRYSFYRLRRGALAPGWMLSLWERQRGLLFTLDVQRTCSILLVCMILSYRDKRTEAFAAGEFVREFQGFERQG